MRHLKTFPLFESTQKLTPEQIRFLDKGTNGTWSLNPSTGLVDIKGDFSCVGEGLSDFKGVRFGKVSGSFSCSYNFFRTLEGGPQTVEGDFYCFRNSLETLTGAPRSIGGDFSCHSNFLRTLQGGPETVGGDFSCHSNSLRSLKGAPQTVRGYFSCSNNPLQSLEGAPKTVGGSFDCSNSPIQTLVGAPETVGEVFRSDGVYIPEGGWTVPNLAKEYLKSRGKRKKDLLGTLVSPEVLQRRIDQNPEKMAVYLKDGLKDLLVLPEYQNIKFPQRLQGEIDLLSDLSGVGL